MSDFSLRSSPRSYLLPGDFDVNVPCTCTQLMLRCMGGWGHGVLGCCLLFFHVLGWLRWLMAASTFSLWKTNRFSPYFMAISSNWTFHSRNGAAFFELLAHWGGPTYGLQTVQAPRGYWLWGCPCSRYSLSEIIEGARAEKLPIAAAAWRWETPHISVAEWATYRQVSQLRLSKWFGSERKMILMINFFKISWPYFENRLSYNLKEARLDK